MATRNKTQMRAAVTAHLKGLRYKVPRAALNEFDVKTLEQIEAWDGKSDSAVGKLLTEYAPKSSALDLPTEPVVTIPIRRFKKFSWGPDVTSVPVEIAFAALSDAKARRYLHQRRLSARVETGDNQQQLDGMEDEPITISGFVDVKSYTVSNDHFSCSLAFCTGDVDCLETFAKLNKQSGRMFIYDVQAIPHDRATADRSEPSHEDVGPDA